MPGMQSCAVMTFIRYRFVMKPFGLSLSNREWLHGVETLFVPDH
jgi:hypothetical protein